MYRRMLLSLTSVFKLEHMKLHFMLAFGERSKVMHRFLLWKFLQSGVEIEVIRWIFKEFRICLLRFFLAFA